MSPALDRVRRFDRRFPITVKAAILMLLISVATGGALGVARVVQTRDRLNDTYDAQAKSIVSVVQAQIVRHPADFDETNALLASIVDTHPTILRIRLFRPGPGGQPLLWASSFHTDVPVDASSAVLAPGTSATEQIVTLDGRRALLVLEPVRFPDGIVSVATYFSAAARDQAIALAKRETIADTIVVVAVELAVLVAAMYVLVLRRVKTLDRAAAEVAAGDLSVRLPEGEEERGRDELANVAGQFSHMVAAIQAREREQAEEAEQRRDLLARLLRAGEEERARIANDMHDDTIQKMTVVSLDLQKVRRTVQNEEQRQALKELEESVNLALQRARHLMFELAPPSLEREGLEAALGQYLAKEAADGEFLFSFDDRLVVDPGPETRNLAYRLAQEAIVNVRKHARADQVDVVIEEVEGGVQVRVLDNGIGFDAATMKAEPGHLGLTAMRERSELAGGWCKIESIPDIGTTVAFWVPDQDHRGDDLA